MKRYKSEIIGFTKNNELVIFDDREEYLRVLKTKNHNFSRVFASARDCVKSVNDEDTLFRNLSKDIAKIVENYGIDIE